MGPNALDSGDSGSQLWSKQSIVGCLGGKLSDRRDPDINRDGPESAGFERNAPRSDRCFCEAGRTRFRRVPGDEFIESEVVNTS